MDDGAGHRLTVTVQMLRDHIDATNEPHCRRTASWLAVVHLRCLAGDPEYMR